MPKYIDSSATTRAELVDWLILPRYIVYFLPANECLRLFPLKSMFTFIPRGNYIHTSPLLEHIRLLHIQAQSLD